MYKRQGASLNGAVAAMTDIGNHSAAAFGDLARSGALRLNARDLPRDLVADDPDLAQARLQGALVPAPSAVVDAIHAEYRVASGHPAKTLHASAPPGPAPGRPDQEVEAISYVTTKD